jgi:hypothetical protein
MFSPPLSQDRTPVGQKVFKSLGNLVEPGGIEPPTS